MDAAVDPAIPSAATEQPAAARPWRRSLLRVAIAYVASRLCVLAGAAIVAAQQVAEQNRIAAETGVPAVRPKNAIGLIVQVLTSWDGAWYYRIVRMGYPTHIPPNVTWDMPEARAAFFPVYPYLVRWLDWVLPGGDVLAGVVLNTLLGGAAIWLIGLLAREIFDERIAYRAMIFVVFFPGSFVLSFTYSEASLLVLAAASMLMLVRRQWVLAGVLAAVGTATRPNAIALIAACAVASLLAIRERREWSSLAAPVLAPAGFVAFQVYLRIHTGEWAWFRVQREAWKEGTSFGLTALRNTWEAFIHPLASPTDIITAVSFLAMLALLWTMWRKRLPWPLMAYTLVVLALMILPETVTARPRFLYTAFPLFISAAAWWPDRRDEELTLVLMMSAAGLVALTGLYGVLGAIP